MLLSLAKGQIAMASSDQPPHQSEDEIPFLSEDVSHPSPTSTGSPQRLPRTEIDVTNESGQSWKASDIKRRLYISHFLSTWNSRVFEFGAVLMLAQIYQETLLPASLYALLRAASAICFSPLVGRFVDGGDRLKVVRRSIIGQRTAVLLSCPGFWILGIVSTPVQLINYMVFGLMAVLACVEKLCSVMNLIAIERDWVVVIAESSQCELEVLNAQMRRIDLVCKLLGPLVIAMVDARSIALTIEVIIGMNALSLLIEYFAIAHVYHMVPALRSKELPPCNHGNLSPSSQNVSVYRRLPSLCLTQVQDICEGLAHYFRHAAFLSSFALCLLYLTVLSFSGQMVTYLVSAGVTSIQIGALRTISTAVEISATWLAPMAMSRIGPMRSALWFINWQIACLLGAVASFWLIDKTIVAASVLIGGMIASRVGLWGFDLCVQILVQAVSPQTSNIVPHTLMIIAGSRGRIKRIFLVPRILSSESLRTLLFCFHHYFCSSRSVSVPRLVERRCDCGFWWVVCEFCEKEQGTSIAPVQMSTWQDAETERSEG